MISLLREAPGEGQSQVNSRMAAPFIPATSKAPGNPRKLFGSRTVHHMPRSLASFHRRGAGLAIIKYILIGGGSPLCHIDELLENALRVLEIQRSGINRNFS